MGMHRTLVPTGPARGAIILPGLRKVRERPGHPAEIRVFSKYKILRFAQDDSAKPSNCHPDDAETS
jgi:hypothetical protein